MVLRLRGLTEEERPVVERLAHSRTAPARRVERARIIWYASQGQSAPAIAEQLRLDAYTARGWIRRFNAEGLAGLEDRPRAGRPPTYAPAQVARRRLALRPALLHQRRQRHPLGIRQHLHPTSSPPIAGR